jgi:hypothetical protein
MPSSSRLCTIRSVPSGAAARPYVTASGPSTLGGSLFLFKTGSQFLLGVMVNGNNLPGDLRLSSSGQDSGAKEGDQVARSPLPVCFIHGHGAIVRRDVGPLPQRQTHPLHR